ncbi:MAG: hypothetical protein R3318_07005 [Gammaproteobacteria bacterium]|nr:hypothetical protein [Gammaproteobacteria bacterium]
MEEARNLYFDLSHFSLIRISGEDATGFLQNQITADMYSLPDKGWLLSAWCLPNGRIITDFILFSEDEHYLLVLPSMLREKVISKLAMYVLRSRVTIEDVSDDYAVMGLYGTGIDDVLNDINLTLKDQRLIQADGVSIINLQDEVPRIMLIMKMDKASAKMNRILMACREGDRGHWSLLDILSGIPWITEPTSESFLPQMLNLDLTGGLSFEKGCYPGQEVIARLHYRSEARKRLYLGSGKGDVIPGPGDELEDATSGQLIGGIVDAEPDPDGGFRFLAAANVNLEDTVKPGVRGSECEIVELTPLFRK